MHLKLKTTLLILTGNLYLKMFGFSSAYLDAFVPRTWLVHYHSLRLDQQQPPLASSRSESQTSGSCTLSLATSPEQLVDIPPIFHGKHLRFHSDQKVEVSKPGTYMTTFQICQSPHYTHYEYPLQLHEYATKHGVLA